MNRVETNTNNDLSQFDDHSDIQEIRQKMADDKIELSSDEQNDLKQLLDEQIGSVDIVKQVNNVLNQYFISLESDNNWLSRSNDFQLNDIQDSLQKVYDKKDVCIKEVLDMVHRWSDAQECHYKKVIKLMQKEVQKNHRIETEHECYSSYQQCDRRLNEYQDIDHHNNRIIGQNGLDVQKDIYEQKIKVIKQKYADELKNQQVQINSLQQEIQNMHKVQLDQQIQQLQETVDYLQMQNDQKDQKIVNIDKICKEQQEKLNELEEKLKEYTVKPVCESEIEYTDYTRSGDVLGQLVDYKSGQLKDRVKTITLTFTRETDVYKDIVQSEIDYSVSLFLNILLNYLEVKMTQQKKNGLNKLVGLQEMVRTNNDVCKKYRIKDLLDLIKMGSLKGTTMFILCSDGNRTIKRDI